MESIASLCLGAILIIGLLIAWAVISRLMGTGTKDAPAGTYDRKDIQSGGSIGGMRGGRAYDSPDFDSGGTIGGNRERRAYDHPDVDSGGSIGGGPSAGQRPGSSRRDENNVGWEVGGDSYEEPSATPKDDGRVDHPNIKSGGSFGG
jgi:hypothetical protein